MTAARLSRSVGGSIFGTDIAGYHTARIGYPDALYQTLRARCGPSVGSILEIGPGTGLATYDLVNWLAPSRLIGVEADAALAAHLQNNAANSLIEIVHSRFEQYEHSGQFDLVCCAAAFHWLEPTVSFRKISQLVRPGGTVALWWNSYRQTGIGDAFADAVTPLLAKTALAPSEGADGHYSLDTAHHQKAMTEAGLSEFSAHLYRRERQLVAPQIRQLYASYSYVRALPVNDREQLLDEIEKLAEFQFRNNVRNIVSTALYMATI